MSTYLLTKKKKPSQLHWDKIKGTLDSAAHRSYKILISNNDILKSPLKELKENTSIKYAIAWALWVLMGTLVYANINFDGNYAIGFYYSISIGYSIGWGVFHDKSTPCKVFSIIYILIGATFVTRWISYLIERSVSESNSSHEKYRVRQHIRSTSKLTGVVLDIYVYLVVNYSRLFMIYVWCVYVFFGTSWSCAVIRWPFIDGLYYAVSSMSTAGAWGVPHDSPDYVFAVTGLFTAFGAPIMGIALGDVASLILESRLREPEYSENTVLDVSENEAKLIKVLRKEDSSNGITQNEFILLCLLREERISIDEMKSICEEFADLQRDSVSTHKMTQSVGSHSNPSELRDNTVVNQLHV